jgi:hypothetical protein
VDLLVEESDHVRLPSNDEEIIACALDVAQAASPNGVNRTLARVHVVTFDHAMAFRARAKLGVEDVLLADEDKGDQNGVSAAAEGVGARARRREKQTTWPTRSDAAGPTV